MTPDDSEFSPDAPAADAQSSRPWHEEAEQAGAVSRHFFFGTIAPITRTVTWSGHSNEVTFRLLEDYEEADAGLYAREQAHGHTDGLTYQIAYQRAVMAMSLDAVDGKSVAVLCPSTEDRFALAKAAYGPLREAYVGVYLAACTEPLVFLGAMESDPDFGTAPSGPGSSPDGAASPAEDSPPTSGRGGRTTRRTTRTTGGATS